MALSPNFIAFLTIGSASITLVLVCLVIAEYIVRIMDALGL